MSEDTPELLSAKVVRRLRDGRRRYDPQAKRALIEACLQPGVSVARLALEHGVNANLLRKWIAQYQQAHPASVRTPRVMPSTVSAFVPVVALDAPAAGGAFRLRARLHNGVEIALDEASAEELSSLLQMLSRLPCSVSTRG